MLIIKIYVHERFKKQLKNKPIPIEFIVIVMGTLFSYFLNLNVKYDLAVVGKIQSG